MPPLSSVSRLIIHNLKTQSQLHSTNHVNIPAGSNYRNKNHRAAERVKARVRSRPGNDAIRKVVSDPMPIGRAMTIHPPRRPPSFAISHLRQQPISRLKVRDFAHSNCIADSAAAFGRAGAAIPTMSQHPRS